MTDRIRKLRELHAKTTPGNWTTTKPGRDPATGFPAGVIVGAVAPGMGIFASPPGGSFPAADREFIAAAHNDLPALLSEHDRLAEEIGRLREALKPFAAIELSTLYSDADAEKYTAIVHDADLLLLDSAVKPDFSRQDVLRARAALGEESER